MLLSMSCMRACRLLLLDPRMSSLQNILYCFYIPFMRRATHSEKFKSTSLCETLNSFWEGNIKPRKPPTCSHFY